MQQRREVAWQWWYVYPDPVPHGTSPLINRQAGLRVALAVGYMMNSHCGSVTTNVSDKQKHPRIKEL